MLLSIKNTRRLEQRMQDMADELTNIKILHSLVVSAYDSNPLRTVIKHTNEQNDIIVQDAISLKKGAFDLRSKIREKNFTGGIDDLIISQLKIKAEIDILEEFLIAQPADCSLIVRAENKLADYSIERGSDEIRINGIMSKERFNEITAMLKSSNRILEEIKDKCAAINISTTIEIPDIIITVANKYDLI